MCQAAARIARTPGLLDLTQQGDVATITDESRLTTVMLMRPKQLYDLWERQHWSSHAIDFARDLRDRESMDAAVRDELTWGLASFFVGEERVATQFGGLASGSGREPVRTLGGGGGRT